MRLLIFLTIAFTCLATFASKPTPVNPLVERLDSVLKISDDFAHAKQTRIDLLCKKKSSGMKDEERLWLNKMLYDEYYVYKADSAMNYVNDNIDIARRIGRKDIEQEWRINKTFLYAAQGLLSEAEKELASIDVASIDKDTRFSYYETAIYLYSHLSQYIGNPNGMSERYDSISDSLRHEAVKYISPSNPSYYSFRASMLTDPSDPEWAPVKHKLAESLKQSPLNNRISAINAYTLAKMCLKEGDEAGHTDNLIKSAIADIRMSNRDIASLEELSDIFYRQGDIDHGYGCISYCFKAALQYPNRVRVVNISSVIDRFQQAAEQRNADQEHKLSRSLLAVSILSIVLVLTLIATFIQFFKLKHSHRSLVDSETRLNEHMKELHETHKRLNDVNQELTEANEKLRRSNDKLVKSNSIKEEYVGYVFSICSNYLTKIEEFRKNIARKLKVGKIEDVKNLISSSQIEQDELNDFYHSFDTIFLHIYPNFVEDFNKLLRPEEQIVLKKDELLNTELRIYALIRLGINNSVKISDFLHISPQTVYNNRLRTRNKAIVSKDEFTARVRWLGKE